MLHIEKERRGNQKVSRAPVAGGRDVVEDREAQQRFDVDIVGLRLERIPEEYEQIDVAFGEHRADLRVAAEGTEESRHSMVRPVTSAMRSPVVPVAKSWQRFSVSLLKAAHSLRASLHSSCAISAIRGCDIFLV